MYGKSNMETYITICKIDSQWEFSVWLRKLKPGLYQPREVGWGGMEERFKRERIYVYLWLIHGEGNGNPLQYSCLGNPMDAGAWWPTVHGVAKSRTQLSH